MGALSLKSRYTLKPHTKVERVGNDLSFFVDRTYCQIEQCLKSFQNRSAKKTPV